jgi:hypothetical protein
MPRFLPPALVAAALFLPVLGFAQANGTGTLYLKTNVGSFKILGIPSRSAEGKIQISFTGTLLINKSTADEPKITTTGNIRKEYDNAQHLQVAYHGTGAMTIDGKFASIQWFGRDMTARWDGFGIARLVGEFDKDLKTGTYWYGENPDDVREWGTNLRETPVPGRPGVDYIVVAKARPGGKGG